MCQNNYDTWYYSVPWIISNNLLMLTCRWWLKKDFAEEVKQSQIDLEKQTIHIWVKSLMEASQQSTSLILMQLISMDGLCLILFLLDDLLWIRQLERCSLNSWGRTWISKKLHDLHNDYSLAPRRLITNKVENLVPNLYHKERYIVHHESLKQYLNNGLKIKKIHRGISFKDEPWLKRYMNRNTNLCTKTKKKSYWDFF